MTVASQVKQTAATLRNIKATLALYAIQSRSVEAKAAFGEASRISEEILGELEERVKTLEFEEPQYKGL